MTDLLTDIDYKLKLISLKQFSNRRNKGNKMNKFPNSEKCTFFVNSSLWVKRKA